MSPRFQQAIVTATVTAFAAGLFIVGALRYQDVHAVNPPNIAGYATLLYVLLTIAAAVLLTRNGVPLRQLGFGPPIRPLAYLVLAIAGVVVLKITSWLLAPLWDILFGAGRDLSRFESLTASKAELFKLLLLSWTVAAIGEELAFRIVLMRSIAYVLGDTPIGYGIALVAQALIFGAVHAYQGPTGVAGTAVNGLIYGGLTLAARGSIWPAALAHGINNTIGIFNLYLR